MHLEFERFTTLWIYTILKRLKSSIFCGVGFTTLWIYTILKQGDIKQQGDTGFTTLWIYTILKQSSANSKACSRFTTLWIYTILKPQKCYPLQMNVLLPYGFTLFSNNVTLGIDPNAVLLPYGFTLFSNKKKLWKHSIKFYYLMDLHYSQTQK